MRSYRIPHSDLEVSRIAYGCMDLGGSWDHNPPTAALRSRAAGLLATALEQGITLFDHADIYTHGKSEALFGEALRQLPGARDSMVLQSKCGIRFPDDPRAGDPGRYDFSRQHILAAVEGSLRRLGTDRLDILLLHRPDALVEPEEVAGAFAHLHQSGKVRHFGVSNHGSAQIALLQQHLDQPLVVNQLELNIVHSQLIDDGVSANQESDRYAGAAGTLDYCRLHEVMVQAWSPLARGNLIAPRAKADHRVRKAARMVAALARARRTSKEAVALAWLLKHPARIQPIVGTTSRERLIACCRSDGLELSREEWYALFAAGRGAPVP